MSDHDLTDSDGADGRQGHRHVHTQWDAAGASTSLATTVVPGRKSSFTHTYQTHTCTYTLMHTLASSSCTHSHHTYAHTHVHMCMQMYTLAHSRTLSHANITPMLTLTQVHLLCSHLVSPHANHKMDFSGSPAQCLWCQTGLPMWQLRQVAMTWRPRWDLRNSYTLLIAKIFLIYI